MTVSFSAIWMSSQFPDGVCLFARQPQTFPQNSRGTCQTIIRLAIDVDEGTQYPVDRRSKVNRLTKFVREPRSRAGERVEQ
jgi:hypothetical protein